MDENRRKIINDSFDRLPQDLRDWVNYVYFRIHDDYILRGEQSVRTLKEYVERGGKIIYTNDSIDGTNRN